MSDRSRRAYDARRRGGNWEFGHGIAVRTGSVAVTGSFYGTIDFGFGPHTASPNSWDVFLLSLLP